MAAKKLSKEDVKFLINTSIYNRDYLLSINSNLLSLIVAVTAVVASIFSIFLTLNLVSPLLLGLISVIIIAAVWGLWYRSTKKLRNRIRRIQKQYRAHLTEIYPDIKDSDFYY
jgi:ABC-type transport system involved in cytochrome bd biosynthesis fused ATPase/permease subunit